MPHSQRVYYVCPLENTRVHAYSDHFLKSDPHTWEVEDGQRRKHEHASLLEILFETENPGVR